MEWTWHLKVRSALEKYSFCEVMIVSKSHNRFRKGAKSASGFPGPKSAPRGSKPTTFGKGIFQSFNLQKFAMNPIRELSVLSIRYPIYL